MKKLKLLIVFFIIWSPVLAQEPNVLWTQTYGYEGDEVCESVKQTSDGGFILAGYSNSFSPLNYDIYIVKTDFIGNMEWEQHHGATGEYQDDKAFDIIEIDDGYIVGGITELYQSYGDIYLFKIDLDGNIIWSRFFDHGPGPTEDCCYSLQAGANGYVLGGYWVYYTIGLHIWILKVNDLGFLEWQYSDYPGSGYSWNECRSVVVDDDGRFTFAGHRAVPYSGDKNMFLLKLNETGNVEWSRLHGTELDDYCYSHVQSIDQGFLLVGGTESPINNSIDFLIVKTDSSGEYLWDQTFGEEGDDIAYSVFSLRDQGFLVGGETCSFGSERTDMYIVQIDTMGNLNWQMTIGGLSNDMCYSVIQAENGDYILGGSTDSYGAGGSDMYLVCLSFDSLGVPADYSQHLPDEQLDFGIYPIPFNQTTAISYKPQASSYMELNVYDIQGREVAKLVDGYQNAGNHEVIFDAKNLVSGVYFVRLTVDGGGSMVRKIVLMK